MCIKHKAENNFKGSTCLCGVLIFKMLRSKETMSKSTNYLKKWELEYN